MVNPLKHLQQDLKLRSLTATIEKPRLKKDNDLYLALLRAIVGQQLSVKAAATIWDRFLALYNGKYPSAELVLNTDKEKLRAAGLSYQKAGYLKNIAEFAQKHPLDYSVLKKMDDEALITYLVQIKGVGRWTVEMVLMFNLGRKDIFPCHDLGIQTAMRRLYNIRTADKKLLIKKMQKLAAHWQPYRSLACFYLWKYKDEVLQVKRPL